MSYVVYAYQKYFGYDRTKATKLMLDVHHKGKAVVSNGIREEMECDAQAIRSYCPWATLEHDR
jgi:ATP-dependent Clp protease adaptor protein ClpS